MNNPPMGDTVTEIGSPSASLISAPAGLPTGLAVSDVQPLAADIGTAGEVYEGSLVTLSHVKVTNPRSVRARSRLTDNNGHSHDGRHAVHIRHAGREHFYNLTGIMDVQLADNIRTVNPGSAIDMAATTGCN